MKENLLAAAFMRMQMGDEDAFMYIYQELKRPVFTISYRIVRSRETAEDITQCVFEKLYLSPPGDRIVNPRAWIFRMTHNLAIDNLRKKQDGLVPQEPIVQENSEDRLDMEAALGRLDTTQREVVSLHINGGLGFGEIASITGLSVSAVYRRYRKALTALRRILEGDDR